MKTKTKKLNNFIHSLMNSHNKTMKRKRKLRVVKSLKRKPTLNPSASMDTNKRKNEQFVEALSELAEIMTRKGEPFRAKAYKSAAEAIMQFPETITTTEQLKSLKNIGKTILSKLHELQTTGKIQILEKERSDPLNQLTRVYGIGPKKAQEFVKNGIVTIEDLRNNEDLLTTNMKLGLKYFDDIETRIPRSEIDEYKAMLTKTFTVCGAPPDSTFEIVGSYRRGNETSGDIDIIITNASNDTSAYNSLLDALLQKSIILETLSRGTTKSMTIARLTPTSKARRLDFLYAPPDEYAFALLYFTGSKTFNTIQRQRALDRGYSLNEHGLYKMENRKKSTTKLVDHQFPSEASIFEFLDMEYVEPHQRTDARAVREKAPSPSPSKSLPVRVLLEQFRTRGKDALDALTEEQLNRMIRKANETYHGINQTPLFTDTEYDILCETTAARFPHNKVVHEGHTNTNIEVSKHKTKLPYEMWSMDKIKPNTQALDKWKHSYKGPYVLSCKLDGVSGLYTTPKETEDGSVNTPKLYTRGNGIIGQDVSHMIPYLKLPTAKGIVLRGEFIVSKNTFQTKYADKFANPRNFVAGVVNQKKVEPDKYRDIDFVCYEVIEPILKPSEQMAFLSKMDSTQMIPVKHTTEPITSKTLTNDFLSQTLQEWRTHYAYDIDGVICSNDKIYPRTKGNPAHSFAFKMMLSEQMAEAKVLNVHWTPSKDGYLKPRVQIEPIELGGVCIEYATGFNAKYVNDNHINTGAIVRIIRSGDVIPHIVEVVSPAAAPAMPTADYEWNPTHVDIILKNPEEDSVVKEKNIAGFFRNIGVDGLSTGHARKIISAGFDTIPKIIKMTQDDFLEVEGFKEKLATKIRTNIETRLGEASLAELMHASNLFGRGFGVKRLQAILDAEPTIVNLQGTNTEEMIAKLQSIPGMAVKTSTQFGKHLPTFIAWLKEAGLTEKLKITKSNNNNNHNNNKAKEDSKNKSKPLYGKKFVITGFRDKELVKKLTELGALNTSSVSKNTDFVIVKSLDETTGKAEEARTLGIKLMTPSEFK